MLHRKNILIKEDKTLTEKNAYQYLYIKDDDLNGDNFTDENERIVEYGKDFINCKNLHSKRVEI